MVGRKGFLRVLEAVLGVIILISFLILAARGRTEAGNEFQTNGKEILDEVAKDESLREGILDNDAGIEDLIKNFVKTKIDNPAVNFSVKVCELNRACIFDKVYPSDVGEVYSVERVISTNPKEVDYEPKKVRMLMWKR